MSPAPRRRAPAKAPAKAPATKKSPTAVADLTPDQVDAVLRDPNVPGDVRVTIADHYNAQRYLQSVKFTEDGNGVTHVSHEEA